MADKEAYVSNFSRFEAGKRGESPEWLRALRRSAIEQFAAQGFPTAKNEAWRFTRVRPLLQHDFKRTEVYKENGFAAERIGELSFADGGCRRLVFVNGCFAENLSSPGGVSAGLRIMSLREALRTHSDLLQRYLAKHANPDTNPFVALNTAYLFDGAFIHIPKGAHVEEPIHLVFASTSAKDALVSYPRNLIVAEEGSRATVIESYIASGDGVYFTDAVSELAVHNNAVLQHCKIQKESRTAYHMGALSACMGRDSRFTTDFVSFGGELVRNEVSATLNGEGVECTLDGLYVADGHQHIDNHTNIEHAKPHCESHEHYKGILSGRARAVFNGKIHVHPDAQKTDAKQSNGCMLLSGDAQINTNPQLEIYADDVKCTHGAVVGQIDENAVFYLRSRGIDKTEARRMLVYAFANEVLERIELQPLRDRLASDLFDWLSKAPGSRG